MDLLKQIDDCASQMGTQTKSFRSRINDQRQSESKRTGEMILGMNTMQRKDGLSLPKAGGLKDSDL